MLSKTIASVRVTCARHVRFDLALTASLALGCWVMAWKLDAGVAFDVMVCVFGMSTLRLGPALMIARIAARHGSRRDGGLAMTLFASYAIGQCTPQFLF